MNEKINSDLKVLGLVKSLIMLVVKNDRTQLLLRISGGSPCCEGIPTTHEALIYCQILFLFYP